MGSVRGAWTRGALAEGAGCMYPVHCGAYASCGTRSSRAELCGTGMRRGGKGRGGTWGGKETKLQGMRKTFAVVHFVTSHPQGACSVVAVGCSKAAGFAVGDRSDAGM